MARSGLAARLDSFGLEFSGSGTGLVRQDVVNASTATVDFKVKCIVEILCEIK